MLAGKNVVTKSTKQLRIEFYWPKGMLMTLIFEQPQKNANVGNFEKSERKSCEVKVG